MTPLIKNNSAIFWGTVTNNRGKHSFDSGKAVTNFSIAYAKEESGDKGSKKTKFISCTAWNNGNNRLADYASCLEKGDAVLLCGWLKPAKDKNGNNVKDDEGNDTYEIVCDMIIVQQQVDIENETEELP